MGPTQFLVGVAVTAAGLAISMVALLIFSRLVDLASRRAAARVAATVEAGAAPGRGVNVAATQVEDAVGTDAAHDSPGFRATDAQGFEAATDDSTYESPARPRSLHLHLRVAGRDFDVEVQPLGRAA